MTNDPLPYDLFDMAKNDQSLYYLGQIFGNMGEVLTPGTGAPIILGAMFEILNGVALTIGVLVVTYTTVVGLFATAAEGEFLGKKWSGVWVPIRTVIGIVSLFPSSGGYCVLQVFLMWVILQGVSAADVVWSRAIDVVSGEYSDQGSMADATEEAKNQMNNIFRGMVCQESLLIRQDNIKLQAPVGEERNIFEYIKYYCKNKTGPFCDRQERNYSINGEQSYKTKEFMRYNFGPVNTKSEGGACGYIEYANAEEVCKENPPAPFQPINFPCASAIAQNQFMANYIINTSQPMYIVARNLVQLDYAYSYFYENSARNAINQKDWDNTSNPWKNFSIIKKYCSAPTEAGGLGLSTALNECCNAASCPAKDKGFQFNSDIYDKSPAGTGLQNASNDVVNAIYIPFGIPDTTFIDTITDLYVKNVITDPYEASRRGKSNNDTAWVQEAKDLGWLMAGSYYVKVAENVRTGGKAGAGGLVVSLYSTPKGMDYPYRNNLTTSGSLISSINYTEAPTSTLTTIAPTQKNVMEKGYSETLGLLNKFITNLTGGEGDPIAQIAKTGQNMMKAVYSLFATYVGLTAIASAGAAAGVWSFMGTGPVESPLWAFFNQAMSFLGPFLIFLLGSLFSVGAMLGIYVPLIPYIIYTVTAVGWFIGVIEAMVAAPFVALGIMSPGGQHEILSRAEPALMIIFNLFLRPALMVFGMIAAMLLSWAVVKMVNAAFASVAWTIIDNGIIKQKGMIEQIIFMIAYTMIIVTIINKCYSLIHMLPERTLTYIGGHAIQYGEEQALQAVKSGVESGAGGMAKAGKAGAIAQWATAKGEEKERVDAKAGQGQIGPVP